MRMCIIAQNSVAKGMLEYVHIFMTEYVHIFMMSRPSAMPVVIIRNGFLFVLFDRMKKLKG